MSTYSMNPGHPRTPAPRRRRGQSPAVRLTRRGRVVVVVLLLALLLAVFTVFGPRSAATRDAGMPVQTRTVEVGPGDTLWGIASAVAEPGEVREAVHHIQELNALTGPGLVVGQEIAVPVG
ncbi:MAG TPA: LysM peptidoglycan-binding domain-containing protein [Nocardioidaceae bacterium]|nr:LysM peptidoglycan-binding domain-containing protein [Nocardioidaceae bacterium]